jgi:hypothetical protein
MKADRELLELAARADGIHLSFKGSIPYLGTGLSAYIWDPLGDDGDALRLAVALDITVAFWPVPQNSVAAYVSGDGVPANTESMSSGRLAATRRAIVRAAAAIGEAMQ